MKPIEGYEHLSDAERELFILAHNKHLGLLKGEERGQYGLGSVVAVTSNPQKNAVDVRFANGQKRQYTTKGIRH
ncbi:hypothetical protein [Domibacillus indicus]|uniref:hypothetical protein n=1 Tax=Domibacillus indicus TaxID=1437523 RepID=UPI000617CD85|nr:hypothetical protein [Domibacillus indicus]